MENKDTYQEAAECLRMALPLLSQYRLPVTPVNYAVLYNYVAGTNEALREAIDGYRGKEEPVTEEIVQALYYKHVSEASEKMLVQAREALGSLIKDIDGRVSKADGEVCRYEQSLAGYSDQLGSNVDSEELRKVVANLADETRAVRETSTELHERLEESHRETEELRRELEKVKHEAATDPLTGLANRKTFLRGMDEMAQMLDGTKGLCLLLVDIDRFKDINDAHGHLLGDKIIKLVGKTMENCVKGKDLVSRYGGEEFAVLLPDTPFPGAMAVAESIRRGVEGGRLIRVDTRQPLGTVTVSVGVARYREGESFDQFIQRADKALYAAKEGGRNRVVEEEPKLADAV